jgi:hypothetical protein
MYPIAYAVAEAKTKDIWIWFLETLMSDLGHHELHSRPTFISDRQKVSYGTCLHFIHFLFTMLYNLNVIYCYHFCRVIPNVDHMICVRHLYANFRDIGGH